MSTPSIGRIIWVYPIGASAQTQPFAAIVTYVHGDRMINAVGWNWAGDPQTWTSLALLQDGDPTLFTVKTKGQLTASQAHAQWMPYQKAVAAGTVPPTLHAATHTSAPPMSPPPPLPAASGTGVPASTFGRIGTGGISSGHE